MAEKPTYEELERRIHELEQTAFLHNLNKIGVWELDTRTMKGIWSEEIYRIHDVPTGAAPTLQESFAFCHHDDRPKLEQAFQRAIANCEPFDMEIRSITTHGKNVWVHINCQPESVEGKTTKLKGTLQDISDRKNTEEELRKSKRELERTLDATADGIWSWNFVTNEIHFSPKYYKMLGYEPNEFQASFENWMDLIHPDDKEKVLAVANVFLQTKPDVCTNEFRLRTKSGEYRWAKTVGNVVERDEHGNAVYMIGNHEDITEQKRALDALIEERERFDLAMRSVNDGLWDWNIVTNEIYYSPVWKKILGYEDHEIKNEFSEWDRLTAPEDVKESWKILNEVIEGKRKSFRNEFKMRHKDGHWVDILARANVITDENGKPRRVIGTHVDITERNRLEKQLNQAQKMEAIGTLAGGIAHDFNNLLGIITGNISYILSQCDKDDELQRVLADVLNASKQAQGLTYQLLTFSKGGEPIKKVADLNKIIREAAIFFIRGAKSTCIFELQDTLWPAEVDDGQINQVINNLIINANQAMPQGGSISIQTENAALGPESGIPLPAGDYVRIQIEDQGVGIATEYVPHIFDPYFTTKQSGSGLGLATTYSIIKKHGGHISVRSEREKGSIFTFYLPASSTLITETKKKPEPRHKGHGRILVMDDQESILDMITRILNALGYEADTAMDGTQVIEMYKEAHVRNTPYDLVILDLTVPGGMGGLKTMEELLNVDPQVKAIVSSGYSNDPIMANYGVYGFCGVAPKPCTMKQLAEVLNQAFGES